MKGDAPRTNGEPVDQEDVNKIRRAVRVFLSEKGKPTFVSRGSVEFAFQEKGLLLEGHGQYFRKVISDEILANGYVSWSNPSGSRRYRTFRRVTA